MNKKRFYFLLCLLIFSNVMWAQELTVPPKKYVDTVRTENAVNRTNADFPLSDQQNAKNWKLLTEVSDEFNGKKLNENIWYPNNPKWQGRPPTYFHGSNVKLENDELVIRVNQHGKASLPDDFTHSTGFIKSKNKFLYGYFEAECQLMDAPWVSGFWMTNVDKER